MVKVGYLDDVQYLEEPIAQFIDIGFGFFVQAPLITCIFPLKGKCARSIYEDARDNGNLVNASCGRKMQTILIDRDRRIYVSAFSVKTLLKRML